MIPPPPSSTLFPYTTLFRSLYGLDPADAGDARLVGLLDQDARRSEEHTSELQSLRHLVCRLLLEKKKNGVGWKGVHPLRHERRDSRLVRACVPRPHHGSAAW